MSRFGGSLGTIHQAGGIVYRERQDQLEFLLISTKDRRSWIFPKGHVEEGEDDVQCALREVEEESGVRGAAEAPLDPPHRSRSGGEDVVVRYILVRALEDGEPEEGRDKRWLGLEDALVLLTHEDARRLLVMARGLVKRSEASTAPRFHDLLLAEHRYLAQTLLAAGTRSEQRVQGFVLVAALVGTASFWLPDGGRHALLACALLFGLVVLRQTLGDAQARRHLQEGMQQLRRSFVPAEDGPRWQLLDRSAGFTGPHPLPGLLLALAALAAGLAASVGLALLS